MSFWTFFKENLFSFVLFVCTTFLIGFGLTVFDTHPVAIFFVEMTITVAYVAAMIYAFARKREFYMDLKKTAKETPQKYLLSEIIDRPSFYEGQLLYDALAASNKSMNDEIARHKNSANDYREYIETWIHEVKTPIAASKLILENSKSDVHGLSPTALRALEEEQNRIEALVEQALFYARSNSLEQDYAIRRIDLETLVKDAIKKHSRALIESGVSPRLENLDCVVLGDQKWLDFILGQLISNAIRYRSDVNPTITFSAQTRESHTYLNISDNGIGISAADLSRVFQKGFTGEHGRQFAKTTGIGLYLCKKMCEKMGLGISVTSIQGEGTTVAIDFPENRLLMDVLEG